MTPLKLNRTGVAVVVAAIASAPALGAVLPGNARPHGWSLADMAAAVANFSISGNGADPDNCSGMSCYPDTPFQIIYRAPGPPCTFGDPNCLGNSFTVSPGTFLYFKVFFIDDSAPVLGTFPTSEAEAQDYIFDGDQLGGHNIEVVIDGQTTTLGREYVPAPVPVPALPYGPGTAYGASNIVQMGAFSSPLKKGLHRITLRGDFDGALIIDLVGHGVHFEINYSVTVQ